MNTATAPLEALRAVRRSTPGSNKRPFTTLSYAQSLDGSLALQAGAPYPISGTGSLRITHMLRAEHDAILVGIGTILADNPQLNVRLATGSDPQAVILDSHLRTPPESKVFEKKPPPWIATTADEAGEPARALLEKGARILTYPKDADVKIPLDEVLFDLLNAGIRSLMVEGGAEVIRSFLQSQAVDWIMLTIAPKILAGLPAISSNRNALPLGPITLQNTGWECIDEDFIVWGSPRWEAT